MATGRTTVRQVKYGEKLRRSQQLQQQQEQQRQRWRRPSSPPEVHVSCSEVEVEGYGPYKPVPPPKPLSQQQQSQQQQQQDHDFPQQPQQQQQQQQSGGSTPPPYRMPPYPPFGEPQIPGAAGVGTVESAIIAGSPIAQRYQQGLHTHSNKFPIEREVILTTTDKDSKIPILQDYKKRSKSAVAPDAPPKQMAAWTQGPMQNMQIMPDQARPSTSSRRSSSSSCPHSSSVLLSASNETVRDNAPTSAASPVLLKESFTRPWSSSHWNRPQLLPRTPA
nr:unnamed protein product [Callosobruchus chinensis]